MVKRGPGRKKEFIGEDELVSRRYDLPKSMADKIDKHADKLKIKKAHLIRDAVQHYFECKQTKKTGSEEDVDLGYAPTHEKIRRLLQIMERSREVTDEVVEHVKKEITDLMEDHKQYYQMNGATSQKIVLGRVIRIIKQNKANLDEFDEFKGILNELEDEASN